MLFSHSKIAGYTVLIVFAMVVTRSATAQCPDHAEALTPAPLETEWAIDWWMPRHEEKLEADNRESAELLFLGDSITQGWETNGKNVWDDYYAGRNAFNLGFSGDRTENVLWRLQHGAVDDMTPELTVLMIGTNNTGHRQDPPECTARGIEMILNELHERMPDTHVLLLAIFPRGETPDDELRQLNNRVNEKIEQFAEHDRVTFLDLNDVFLDDRGHLSEEIMPDHLHPHEYGYRLWADAMEPELSRLLNE